MSTCMVLYMLVQLVYAHLFIPTLTRPCMHANTHMSFKFLKNHFETGTFSVWTCKLGLQQLHRLSVIQYVEQTGLCCM